MRLMTQKETQGQVCPDMSAPDGFVYCCSSDCMAWEWRTWKSSKTGNILIVLDAYKLPDTAVGHQGVCLKREAGRLR